MVMVLGLATSYSIIQKHNGFINFTSNEKEGTEFIFFIPMSFSAVNPTNGITR